MAPVDRDVGSPTENPVLGVPATSAWLPTPANVNALPYPIRRYIHDIETACARGETMRENILVQHENQMLRAKIAELISDRGAKVKVRFLLDGVPGPTELLILDFELPVLPSEGVKCYLPGVSGPHLRVQMVTFQGQKEPPYFVLWVGTYSDREFGDETLKDMLAAGWTYSEED